MITNKIKKNILLGIVLAVFYTAIRSHLPINGGNVINTLVNQSYRIILLVLMILGYVYHLTAQFYLSKTENRLIFKLVSQHREKNIIKLLMEAINTTLPKYQADILGKTEKNSSGIVFGRDDHNLLVASPETEEDHVLCIGGTKTGKTSALLIPTLRVFKGNAFVVDISGDISENVHRQNTLIFAPLSDNSLPYNVFYGIDNEPDYSKKLELLSQLAYLLMPEEPDLNDDGRYFADNGRKMLNACLIHYYKKNMDFCEICREIILTDLDDLLNDIWESADEDTRVYISSFRKTNEKNNAGCKQAMDQTITLFASNHNVRMNLRRPKLNENFINPERMEDYDIFVQIPQDALKIIGPLFALILGQMFEFFYHRPLSVTKPLLFCLDEFACLGRIDILNALRTLRKRHVRIMLLTQSFADLDDIYGQNKRKIMSDNCGYKVILKATDPDTQEYISRLIGEHAVEKVTHSWDGTHKSYTISMQNERIVEPAELAYLGDELILIGPTGYMRLQKNFYYKNYR